MEDIGDWNGDNEKSDDGEESEEQKKNRLYGQFDESSNDGVHGKPFSGEGNYLETYFGDEKFLKSIDRTREDLEDFVEDVDNIPYYTQMLAIAKNRFRYPNTTKYTGFHDFLLQDQKALIEIDLNKLKDKDKKELISELQNDLQQTLKEIEEYNELSDTQKARKDQQVLTQLLETYEPFYRRYLELMVREESQTNPNRYREHHQSTQLRDIDSPTAFVPVDDILRNPN